MEDNIIDCSILNSAKKDCNIYYFGTKANPLTLAHERIIRQLINIPNATVVVGIAPVDHSESNRVLDKPYNADFRKSEVESLVATDTGRSFFDVQRMLEHISEEDFSTKAYADGRDVCACVRQEAYSGLYRWITSSSWYIFLKNKYGKFFHFHLVVGTDEFDAIKEDKWVDSDKIQDEWDLVNIDRDEMISSTAVRDIFWRDPHVEYYMVSKYISREVYDVIRKRKLYWQRDETADKKDEFLFLKNYNPKKFPSVGVTVDNVVMTGENNVTDRKVLLIRRGGHPYKGYWALPGGFLDANKDLTLLDAAYRELYEETNLGVSHIDADVYGTRQFAAYSDIGVDPRMRICDVVFVHTVCDDKIEQVKAADDASDIAWFSVINLPKMAFNHAKVIEDIIMDREIQESRSKYPTGDTE